MSTSSSPDAGGALARACAARFSERGAPLVSVIVPVYNNWAYTARCLASVTASDQSVALELIVVDDASTDETPAMLERLPGLRVVRNAKNVGFVHGCNRAASVARGRYLFFLNNDTEMRPNAIAALVRRIESDAGIGVAGSKLIYPDGTLQEAGGIIWSDGFAWNYGRFEEADRPEYNFVRDVDYVSGAALLVRAKLFEAVGRFDERYAPAYYEDADLCFAVRGHGERVVFEPASTVVHFEGLTAGRDVNVGMKRFFEINRPKFESKWYRVLRERHLPFSEGNVVRAARARAATGPAVLVAGPTLAGDEGRRLRSLSKAFAAGGRRVACLPADGAGPEPWTREMQDAGVEVVLDAADRTRGVAQKLAGVLPTVDCVVLSGARTCARYLPAVRAHCDLPVAYDGTESRRPRWSAGELDATCVRAADLTLVRDEAEAELLRSAAFGPAAAVPPIANPGVAAVFDALAASGAAAPAQASAR